ncbi:MAG TPA: 2-oxo acid dehydrogenase subunit E2, partial [Phycisphaerae bacterium]|nr:2-oxo acid dehydrogenase subunit E2 [Phycisphaerae bacterium]
MSETQIIPVEIPRQTANDDTMFLLEWLVGDASQVRAGDAICKLESSKAAFEFSAPCDGFLHIISAAGKDLPVGETIAWITSSADRPGQWPSKPTHKQQHAAAAIEGDLKITAKARSLMEKHNIADDAFANLSLVREKDVLEYLQKNPTTAVDGDKLQPHSHLQLQTAKVLTKSFGTIPHSYLSKHVSAASLESAVEKICLKDDILISLSDLLVSTIAGILRDFPKINSTWLDAGLMLHREIALGVALNQNDGTLVVPVIHNADSLSLTEIAGKIRGFQKRSIRNRLTVEDLTGGHFSVTTMIGTGVSQVFPIIYPEQ